MAVKIRIWRLVLVAVFPQIAAGVDPEDFIAAAREVGRDNARTPVQWAAAPQAGFTTGAPWIEANPDRADAEGVFQHYRRLIRLRRESDIVVHGRFAAFAESHPWVMAYTRELDGARLSVVANLSGAAQSFDVVPGLEARGVCVSWSRAPREIIAGTMALAPWEAVAVLQQD